MKYVIYRLLDNFGDVLAYSKVLHELRVKDVNSRHDTLESATDEILNNKGILEGMELTILPIFNLNNY